MPQIAWGARVSAPFKTKVLALAGHLGCDPSNLMACMAFETGETFSPCVTNPMSGAIGLIQFMPKTTAPALGTSAESLGHMSDVDQLDYVAKYLEHYRGHIHTLSDLYMTILWPAAVGKPESFVLFAAADQHNRAYLQNKGLDINHDGAVTKAEAASKVHDKLVKGLQPGFIG